MSEAEKYPPPRKKKKFNFEVRINDFKGEKYQIL